MAQQYIVVERKNPLKPENPTKFYAMARSSRKVDTDEVIKRIAERSSYSIGELNDCITEFLLEIKNQLELGGIVVMGTLGSFRMTITTENATLTAKEFKAATCIKTYFGDCHYCSNRYRISTGGNVLYGTYPRAG